MNITIAMPNGCRYMGEDNTLLGKLPLNGKFILNKTVTGCGGTSLFLNSDIPVVIISPRLHALKESMSSIQTVFFSTLPIRTRRKERRK